MNSPQFQPDFQGGPVFLPDALVQGDTAGRRSLVSEYLSVANRRKWLILGTVVAFLIGGLLVTLFTTPLYKTSAVLEIQRESRNFAEVKGTDQGQSANDAEFYQTQYGLLKSRALAERIARSLRVSDDPAFFDRFGVEPGEGCSRTAARCRPPPRARAGSSWRAG
jgi:polysaccharide biosynthesis transport protein